MVRHMVFAALIGLRGAIEDPDVAVMHEARAGAREIQRW